MPWGKNDKHQFPPSRAIGLWTSVLCTTALNNIMQISTKGLCASSFAGVTKLQWKAKTHCWFLSTFPLLPFRLSERYVQDRKHFGSRVYFFFLFFSFMITKFFSLHCHPECRHQFFWIVLLDFCGWNYNIREPLLWFNSHDQEWGFRQNGKRINSPA